MHPNAVWPRLPIRDWQPTCTTLQLWTQIVGKVRLALAPLTNHWWNVTLYVTPRGLTTSAMPSGGGYASIDFDFVDHVLLLETSEGGRASLALEPQSVAAFYRKFQERLASLGIDVKIWPVPVEMEERIPFERDEKHGDYDREAVERFRQTLVSVDRALEQFRCGFVGKVSPVHFFWGAFDLAVTRFSGRPAPQHPGAPNIADWVTREAYSHEVSSAGFWPGGGELDAAFYSYAYPEPKGYSERPVRPREARYERKLGEFLLPYEAVRTAPDPEQALRDFLDSTYEAAAETAGWDRNALERRS